MSVAVVVVVAVCLLVFLLLKESSCRRAIGSNVARQRPQVQKQPAVLRTVTLPLEIWPLD